MSTVSMYYLCSLSLTRPTTAVSIFPGHTSMRFGPRSWSGSGSGLSAEEKKCWIHNEGYTVTKCYMPSKRLQ